MKIETKEIYKCEYCNKLYQIKRFAERHEEICFRNPINDRNCLHCRYLDKKDYEEHYDTYRGSDSRILKLFYCDKIKSFLYPPKVEIKGNDIELPDEYNEPMKTDCKIFAKEKET